MVFVRKYIHTSKLSSFSLPKDFKMIQTHHNFVATFSIVNCLYRCFIAIVSLQTRFKLCVKALRLDSKELLTYNVRGTPGYFIVFSTVATRLKRPEVELKRHQRTKQIKDSRRCGNIAPFAKPLPAAYWAKRSNTKLERRSFKFVLLR